MLIFKIVREAEWLAAELTGAYDGSAHDKADGFLHFSTAPQLRGTLEKHYATETGRLVIAACDDAPFGEDLRWEVSRGGEPFPHLFASLPVKAVIATHRASYADLAKSDFAALDQFFASLEPPE